MFNTRTRFFLANSVIPTMILCSRKSQGPTINHLGFFGRGKQLPAEEHKEQNNEVKNAKSAFKAGYDCGAEWQGA